MEQMACSGDPEGEVLWDTQENLSEREAVEIALKQVQGGKAQGGLWNELRSHVPQPPSCLLAFSPQGPSGQHRSRHLQVRRWSQTAISGEGKGLNLMP